jgi:hypothetical protein
MPNNQTTGPASAADVHDAAVIKAALAVLGTMFPRRQSTKIGDATESLNLVLTEIEDRINASRKQNHPHNPALCRAADDGH